MTLDLAGTRDRTIGETDLTRAKSVILFIGDGMGRAQREAARLLTAGGNGARDLVMDGLPVSGLVGTSCADPEGGVTDSAAAATALATGVKTTNGAVAVDPDGRPLPTILELAKAAGKATGLVTTCQVTDATPAAFAAHVPNRADQHEIARQFIEETGVDVILGGGRDWWQPAAEVSASGDGSDEGECAPPRRDLIARARELGYAYVETPAQLAGVGGPKVLGLFDDQELFRQNPEGADAAYEPVVSLRAMTEAALAVLSRNSEGFFLMVEEAAVDRMGHHNNGPLAIKGVRELDRAVAEGLAYVERHPDTLLIVTADHECGGLALGSTDDVTSVELALTWATTGHTAAGVPLTAKGAGAEALRGEYENTHVPAVMGRAMGLAGLRSAPFGATSPRA